MVNERGTRMLRRALLHHQRRRIPRFAVEQLVQLAASGRHLRRLHEELRLQPLPLGGGERGVGHGKQTLDLLGPLAGLGIGVCRHGDAEAAQPADIIVGKKHVDIEVARRGERLFQHEDGHVSPAFAAADLPERLQVLVDRLVDRGLAGVVRGERAGDVQLLAAAMDGEIGQTEIARRPFVENAARSVGRQSVVRQDLQANGRDAAKVRAELQVVGVGLRLVAADEDRVVRLNGQQRHVGTGLHRAKDRPVPGVLARLGDPLGEGGGPAPPRS